MLVLVVLLALIGAMVVVFVVLAVMLICWIRSWCVAWREKETPSVNLRRAKRNRNKMPSKKSAPDRNKNDWKKERGNEEGRPRKGSKQDGGRKTWKDAKTGREGGKWEVEVGWAWSKEELDYNDGQTGAEDDQRKQRRTVANRETADWEMKQNEFLRIWNMFVWYAQAISIPRPEIIDCNLSPVGRRRDKRKDQRQSQIQPQQDTYR